MARGGRLLAMAFFESPASGQAVAFLLARRQRADEPPGCVGVLTLDPRGQPVAHPRPRGHHAYGVEAVLGVLAFALCGRRPPAAGPLLSCGSDLSADDLARFAAELESGQALVAVLDRRRGAERAVVALGKCGGRAELHRITGRGLRQVTEMSAALCSPPPGP